MREPGAFINHIASYRREQFLTQAQLARMVRISRQAMCEIEKSRVVPSVQIALRLAEVLNTSVENLFQQEWKEKPNIDADIHEILKQHGLDTYIMERPG